MKPSSKGFLYRFPRIGGIVIILFISMFALDIFDNNYTFWQTVVGLFMHLIPSWILIAVLIVSRKKYELVGAIAFGLFGIAYTIICIIQFIGSLGNGPAPYYLLAWPLIIALPPLAIGLTFFLHRRRERKR